MGSAQKTAEKSFSGSAYKSPIAQNIEDETVRALREQIDIEN